MFNWKQVKSIPSKNVLHVDNKRTDDYNGVADGTPNRPYRDIQSANDAITGNSSSNRFVIKVATGASYSGNLTLDKDFVTIEGYGETIISGNITITSPHVRFKNIKTIGNVTLNKTSHFLLEVVDCSVNTGTWNITASVPTGDEWFQISGASTIWESAINATGVTGVLSINGGYFAGVSTLTNCIAEIVGCEQYGATFNLEADTEATISSMLTIDTVINLKTDAILNIDSSSLGGCTINNTGGTLNLTSAVSMIKDDSSFANDQLSTTLNTLYGIQGKIKWTETSTAGFNYLADMLDTLEFELRIAANKLGLASGYKLSLEQKLSLRLSLAETQSIALSVGAGGGLGLGSVQSVADERVGSHVASLQHNTLTTISALASTQVQAKTQTVLSNYTETGLIPETSGSDSILRASIYRLDDIRERAIRGLKTVALTEGSGKTLLSYDAGEGNICSVKRLTCALVSSEIVNFALYRAGEDLSTPVFIGSMTASGMSMIDIMTPKIESRKFSLCASIPAALSGTNMSLFMYFNDVPIISTRTLE